MSHVLFITLSIALTLACCSAERSDALEMPAAYSSNELEAVRAWEKTWAGRTIDKTTIDQVAAFMPPSYVGMYKNPDQWGAPAEGLYFHIVPYRQMQETSGLLAATRQYAPHCRLDEKGALENITRVAGRPFPRPATGIEVAWNYELNTKGDSSRYRKFSPNINPRNRTERYADQEVWELYFINRTDVDPRPAFSDDKNPKHCRKAMFIHMYKPPEFLNTRMFNLRFIDQNREDDAYLWYNQFRRIRRMSTAQRTDSIDGSDLIYDDDNMWDGQLLRNTYTLKGTKDMLASRHQDMKQTKRQTGQGIVNGLTLERCNLYVVEALNKDPNYLYSRRVWYIDPETYCIMWQEIYDQQGRFWKCFMSQTGMLQTASGETRAFIVGAQYHDFQRNHCGAADHQLYYEPQIGIAVDGGMFTVGYLQKTY
jgi:hypothetical protein